MHSRPRPHPYPKFTRMPRSAFTQLLALLPLALSLSTAPIHAQLANPTSTLTEVTVYRQGALVKRTGRVTVTAGNQDLAFTGLEQSIRPGSVQLAVAQSVSTFALDVTQDPSRAPAEPDTLLGLRDQLAALDDSLARLSAERAGLNEELAVLAANRDLTGEQATPSTSATAVRDAARLYRELTTEAQLALARLKPREERLQKRQQQLQQRIGAIRPQPAGNVGRITAKVIAERAGTFAYEFSYIVNNASWTPDYDLYVQADEDTRARLTLSGNVQQYTGVDWTDVKLTLSSSDINSRLAPPELSPLYLGRDVASLRSNMAGYAKELEAADGTISIRGARTDGPQYVIDGVRIQAAASNAAPTYATATNSAAARLYTVDRPFSLAANGRPSAVRLTSHELPLSLRYHVVPKREPTAYLTGVVTGWDTLNLLGANVRLHLDERYLGDTYLDPAQNSDTLTVGLGPDPRVVVERKPLGRGSDTKLIRNLKTYDLGYEISLRNTRSVPIDILVEDQIPVSQRDEVEVELKSATASPSVEASTGKLTWQLSLKPATREQLVVRYDVKAPKEVVVNFE